MRQVSRPIQLRISARFLPLLLVMVFVFLGGKLIYIQARESPRLVKTADQQQRSIVPIPARRGMIFDRRGRILAGTQSGKTVFADCNLLGDPAATADKLAPILEFDARELAAELSARPDAGFLVLRRRLSRGAVAAIEELDLPGIQLLDEPHRQYPQERLLAQVLGLVSVDDRGIDGLEMTYDRVLRGEPGHKTFVRDRRRRPIVEAPSGWKAPRDGDHLVLNIDSVVQQYAETALQLTLERWRAESAVAVVMNPNNGEVLAMANVPTFDLNSATNAPDSLRRNRTVTDPVEPGSSFKPIIGCKALEGDFVRLESPVNCGNGSAQIGSRRMRDTSSHGVLTFEEVIVLSSNIGMAIIGDRMGNRPLYDAVQAFGFAQRTGLDCSGESPGILLPIPKWSGYSKTSIPIGQELAVTPIQMAVAYSAIANGGTLYQPRLLKAVVDSSGNVIEDHSAPVPVGRAISPEMSKLMTQRVMVKVVDEGTGKRARIEGYSVAGKTGTAQIPRKNRKGYDPGCYLSVFCGVAPASDPQVTVLVMVTKPDPALGYYGGTVAAPAFRDIMQQTLSYLKIPPDRVMEEKTAMNRP